MAAQTTVPGEALSPALAFANSRFRRPQGWTDLAGTGAELGEWLAAHALPSDTPARAAAELSQFHELREAIRELLLARAEGRTPPDDALACVNRASASLPGAVQLAWPAGAAPGRGFEPAVEAEPLARSRAALAVDAIELVAGGRGELLVACGGPRCVRLLLKDHPRRQWCGPRCGERARAARYYERHKKPSTA